MLEIKIIFKEMQNAFDGLITRLVMNQERISDLEYKAIEMSQSEIQ